MPDPADRDAAAAHETGAATAPAGGAGEGDEGGGAAELSSLGLAMLAVERDFTTHTPDKERRIIADTGLGVVRYYQVLDRLMQTEEARRADPMVVARYERLTAARRRRRRGAAGA